MTPQPLAKGKPFLSTSRNGGAAHAFSAERMTFNESSSTRTKNSWIAVHLHSFAVQSPQTIDEGRISLFDTWL
jgi:hypothetical protein